MGRLPANLPVFLTCTVVVSLGLAGYLSVSSGQAITQVDVADVAGAGFLLCGALTALLSLLRSQRHTANYWLVFAGTALLCGGFLADLLDEFRVAQSHLESWIENLALMAGASLTAMGLLRWGRHTRAAHTEVQQMALTDPLTGLGNRRSMEQAVTSALGLAMASNSPLAVLVLDLDHFKQVNDVHGHDRGDEVLKAFAGIIRHSCRSSDLMFRVGGEEFLIVLLGADLTHGRERAENIRRRLRDLFFRGAGGARFSVTTSIGLTWLGALDDGDSLRRRADQALYLAKRSGRDRVEEIGPDDSHRLPLAQPLG